MKPVFNSLGSNYTTAFIRQVMTHWCPVFRRDQQVNLQQRLNQMFDGQTYFVLKGRDAIEFGLRAHDVGRGDRVLTQAFTCFAIEEAITRTRAKPVYVDLAKDSLNPSLKELDQARRQFPDIKVVIIQHTLGVPAPILEISRWAHKNKILLIEDLAQAYGGIDAHNQPLGSQADVIVLSFGRDKILDCVSGGAVIFKSHSIDQPMAQRLLDVSHQLLPVPRRVVIKDKLYPVLTWLIRRTYRWGIGQAIFQGARFLGLLTSPVVSPLPKMASLPKFYLSLLACRLNQLDQELAHRREIATLYHQGIFSKLPKIKKLLTQSEIETSSNQRYLLWVEDVTDFIDYMKKNQVFISDRWYRRAVDSGVINARSAYVAGSCPHAEQLAIHIVNLPTHWHIDQSAAQRIIELINNYESLT